MGIGNMVRSVSVYSLSSPQGSSSSSGSPYDPRARTGTVLSSSGAGADYASMRPSSNSQSSSTSLGPTPSMINLTTDLSRLRTTGDQSITLGSKRTGRDGLELAALLGASSTRQNTLLSSYVQYIFDCTDTPRPFYLVLADEWLKLMSCDEIFIPAAIEDLRSRLNRRTSMPFLTSRLQENGTPNDNRRSLASPAAFDRQSIALLSPLSIPPEEATSAVESVDSSSPGGTSSALALSTPIVPSTSFLSAQQTDETASQASLSTPGTAATPIPDDTTGIIENLEIVEEEDDLEVVCFCVANVRFLLICVSD